MLNLSHGKTNYQVVSLKNSCGYVEDKYWIFDNNSINALHLIREIYDEDVLRIGSRRWCLTEKHHEKRKQELLVPQVPYPTNSNTQPAIFWDK